MFNSITKSIRKAIKWCWATLPRRIISTLVIAGLLFSSFYFLLLRPKAAEAGWWDEDWLFRKKLTVDQTVIDAVLTDFPALVKLTSSNFTFSNARSNGYDIRFTDNFGNLLKYERERWDSGSQQAEVWVKIPTVYADAPTYIYMYYGNASAPDGQSPTEVWDTNYVMVQHMDDDPDTSHIDDSTTNYDGTKTSAGNPAEADAKIAKGQDISSDKINLGVVTQVQGASQVTLSSWFNANTVKHGGPTVDTVGDNTSRLGIQALPEGEDAKISIYFRNGGWDYATTQDFSYATGEWYHCVARFDGTQSVNADRVKFYINGEEKSLTHSGTHPATTVASLTALYIGQTDGGYFDGKIDEVRITNDARSAAEIKADYNSGNDTLFSTYGSEEKGTGPVGYWKFDEGYGTTAYDNSDQGNDGTLGGDGLGTDLPSWRDESSCKFGKCLDFDGDDDYVSVSNNIITTTEFTVSAWAKMDGQGGGSYNENIIFEQRDDSTGDNKPAINLFAENTSGNAMFQARSSNGSVQSISTTKKNYNEWHHYGGVVSSSTIYFYIDGILINSTNNNQAGDYTTGVDYRDIGRHRYSSANWGFFNGIIDDVKIYPYARSAAQILRDYNYGAAARVGRDDSWLTEGLVGYWKMDEASWSGAANEVVDSSGAGNHGQAACTGGGCTEPTTAAGHFHKAGDFDGSEDYVNVGSDSSLDDLTSFTVSAWVKHDDVSRSYPRIFHKGSALGGLRIEARDYSGGSYRLFGYRVYSTTAAQSLTTSVMTCGVWHYLTFTYDESGDRKIWIYLDGDKITDYSIENASVGTITTDASSDGAIGVDIAAGPAYFWDGKLDDLRIYNRALSEFEVRRLYEWGPGPVAHWKFDEDTGQTAYDTSENSNDGTLGSGGTPDSADPTWKSAADCHTGSCLDFDASNDYVNAGSNASLDNLSPLTLSAWIKADSYGEGGNYGGILDKANGPWKWHFYGGLRFERRHTPTNMEVRVSYPTEWFGIWKYVTVTWNGGLTAATDIDVYINGAEVSHTYDINGEGTPTDDSAGNLTIGAAYGTGYTFDGLIDDIKIYNYVRTQKQILEDMLGGRPVVTERTTSPGSMVGYWKMDEGYGDTAYDSSGRGNNGDLAGSCPGAATCPSWTTQGKFGRALDFGGDDDYVTFGDIEEMDGVAALTVGLWVNGDIWNSSHETLFAKYDSDTARIEMRAYYTYLFLQLANGSDSRAYTVPTVLTTGVWQHLVMVFNGGGTGNSERLKLYLNGELQSMGYIGTIPATTASTTASVLAGSQTTSTFPFDGTIDEVKIYNVALSPEEILLEYNRGKAVVMDGSPSGTTNTGQAAEYCVPGDTSTCNPPVAEWKMDEKTGTTLYDTSANTNDGSFSGAPAWRSAADCHSGSCLDFDGSDDFVSIGTELFLYEDLTVSAWIYIEEDPSVGTTPVIVRSSAGTQQGWILYYDVADDKLKFQVYYDNRYRAVTAAVNQGQWYHVVGWANSGTGKIYLNGELGPTTCSYDYINYTSTQTSQIGAISGSEHWNGKIDQVRIYDYARTPAQIAWEYNRGAPVGHWKFDEGEGVTAYDSSVNNNSGTLGGDGQGADVPTWTTSGKFNSGLTFDGGDYILVGDIDAFDFGSSNFTISLWAKLDSLTANMSLVSKCSTNETGWQFTKMDSTYNNNVLEFYFRNTWPSGQFVSSNANAIADTTNWHHVAVVRTGDTTFAFYVDGKDWGTPTPDGGAIESTDYPVRIGDSYVGGRPVDGTIDEVKIYNYALTAEQIKMDYNRGAALRFGE